MKQKLALVSGVLGIGNYVVLIITLLKTNASVSFATFLLWAALALIVTINTMLVKGNYALPLGYLLGAIATTFILLCKKQYGWSTVEWFTLVLVAACIIVWLTSGPGPAIIACSTAAFIAGVPQLKTAWDAPHSIAIPIWIGFLLANILACFAGKDWSAKERLYSGSAAVYCALVIGFALLPR